jgi:glycosyltransferase involved in cell wall biosynthesis
MIRVSVCMPVYNGMPYLKEQVNSILGQLTPNDEVIVSDDGSTDDSVAWLESLNDPRIHVLTDIPACNPSYNLEKALRLAQGKYILLADQDDVWLPRKVDRMLAALQHHSLVVHDCSITDEYLNIQTPSFMKAHGSGSGFWKNYIRNSYLGCCMGFRREVLQKALPFPKYIGMHDIWLGLVAALWHETAFISEALVLYRRHGKNASTTSDKSKLGLWQQLKLRLILALQLSGTIFR